MTPNQSTLAQGPNASPRTQAVGRLRSDSYPVHLRATGARTGASSAEGSPQLGYAELAVQGSTGIANAVAVTLPSLDDGMQLQVTLSGAEDGESHGSSPYPNPNPSPNPNPNPNLTQP